MRGKPASQWGSASFAGFSNVSPGVDVRLLNGEICKVIDCPVHRGNTPTHNDTSSQLALHKLSIGLSCIFGMGR
jgi:hypothetical protein